MSLAVFDYTSDLNDEPSVPIITNNSSTPHGAELLQTHNTASSQA